MAGMQDPLTDLPPPSRFDFDELSNFSFCASLSDPPSIVFSPSVDPPRNCKLLLIASTASGCHLLHYLPNKLLLGSVILPEIPSPRNSPNPSLLDRACYLYALDEHPSVVLACIQYSIPPERAYAWVKLVFESIRPEIVLMLAAVQSHHFRGSLSAEDQLMFRLETDRQRLATEGNECTIPYFPSGSLVDGIGAAVLSRCQVRGLQGSLLLSWPDGGASALPLLVSAVKSLLQNFPEAPAIDFSLSLKAPFKRKCISDSDLYL